MKDVKVFPLLFFIWLLSLPSLTALFPVKSTSRILTWGPSSTTNVRFTSFGPPAIGLISGVTLANW